MLLLPQLGRPSSLLIRSKKLLKKAFENFEKIYLPAKGMYRYCMCETVLKVVIWVVGRHSTLGCFD